MFFLRTLDKKKKGKFTVCIKQLLRKYIKIGFFCKVPLANVIIY